MCPGPAVQTSGAGPMIAATQIESELGGDDHPIAVRGEHLADELLVGERAIHLGGVEEGDAAFRGGLEQSRLREATLVGFTSLRPLGLRRLCNLHCRTLHDGVGWIENYSVLRCQTRQHFDATPVVVADGHWH